MSNRDVIALVAALIPTDVILTKIATAKVVSFDVSTNGLIELNKAQVPSAVVKAMMERAPSAPATLGPSQQHRIVANPYGFQRRTAQWGLISTYAATVLGAAAMGDAYFGTTSIPVVGPWVTKASIEGDPDAEFLPSGKSLLTASGILQGGFLIYFIMSRSKEAAYERNLSIYQSPRGAGLAMRYRFGR